MATFVNVYLFTFIRTPSAQKLLTQALKLTPDEQVRNFKQNSYQRNFIETLHFKSLTSYTFTNLKISFLEMAGRPTS